MHLGGLQPAARQTQAVAVDGELQGAGKVQPQRTVGSDVKGQLHRGEGQGLPAPALGFLAQSGQLAQRALIQGARLPLQLAHAGHLVDPSLCAGGLMHLFPVRDAHPADQQTAAILGQHGLRRVELKPAVQLVQRAVVEGAALGVEAACHPHRRIGIEKALRFTGQPLRAADQQVGIRQRKEIRALPHIAAVRQTVNAMSGDLAHQAPLPQIAGGKQQHFTVLLHILRAEDHVPAPVLLPHLGVAYMAGVTVRERQHRPQLAEGAIGIFRRQALPGGAPAVGEFHVAGVAQGQGALELDRAAGVAAVAVILFVRHQGDRFMPPVQQIG